MSLNHLLFFAIVYIISFQSWAQSVFQYDKKWEILSNHRFTQVPANFDSNGGGFDKLPPGHVFQVFHVEPKFRYGLGNLGVRGSVLYGYAQSEDGVNKRTNGAIDHLALGLDYSLSYGGHRLVPRLQYRLAQSKNSLFSDIVAIGDGVNTIEAGFEVFTDNWALPMIFDIAYLNRDSLSQLLKMSALAQIPLGQSNIFGGVSGFSTIMGETQVNNLSRHSWFCRANGCSTFSQAINPGVINLVAGWSSQHIGFEISHGINGINAAQETRLNLFIRLASQVSAHSRIKKSNRFNGNPVFIEDTATPIEDDVFKAPRVINPINPEKKQSPDKSLDQIEMQLELRQKKKKRNRR